MLGLNEDFATGSSLRHAKSGLFVIYITGSGRPGGRARGATVGKDPCCAPVNQPACSSVSARTLATLPAVYLYRRVEFSREYRMQLRLCRQFAAADPDRLVQELYSEDGSDTPLQPSDRITLERPCFDVLG